MLRTLDDAQKALHKFEVDEVSLAENDLGNVTIRWVVVMILVPAYRHKRRTNRMGAPASILIRVFAETYIRMSRRIFVLSRGCSRA